MNRLTRTQKSKLMFDLQKGKIQSRLIYIIMIMCLVILAALAFVGGPKIEQDDKYTTSLDGAAVVKPTTAGTVPTSLPGNPDTTQMGVFDPLKGGTPAAAAPTP